MMVSSQMREFLTGVIEFVLVVSFDLFVVFHMIPLFESLKYLPLSLVLIGTPFVVAGVFFFVGFAYTLTRCKFEKVVRSIPVGS